MAEAKRRKFATVGPRSRMLGSRLTRRQYEVLALLLRGEAHGQKLHIKAIHDMLYDKPSQPAFNCTLNAMECHGWIERSIEKVNISETGTPRSGRIVSITDEGRRVMPSDFDPHSEEELMLY